MAASTGSAGYASPVRRALAFVANLAILLGVLSAYDAYVGRLPSDVTGWLALGAVGALGLLHVVSIAIGADAGHRLLGLRVVRPTGGPIGLGRALVRELAFALALALLAAGVLTALADRRRQGWHDKLAGSVVVPRAQAAGIDRLGRRRTIAVALSAMVVVAVLIGGGNVAQALPPRLDAVSRSEAPPFTPLVLTVGAIHRERTTSVRFTDGDRLDLELPALVMGPTTLGTVTPYVPGGARALSVQVVQRAAAASWRSEMLPFTVGAPRTVPATEPGVTTMRLLDVIDVVAVATRERLTGSLDPRLAVELDRLVAGGATLSSALQKRTGPRSLIRVGGLDLLDQPGSDSVLRSIDQVVAAALVATGPNSPSPCPAKDGYIDDLLTKARGTDAAADAGRRFWGGVLGCASDDLLEIARRLGFASAALALIALGAGITFSVAASLAMAAVVISIALFVIVAELQVLALTAEREHASRISQGLGDLVNTLVDPMVEAILALATPSAAIGWTIFQAGAAIAQEAKVYVASAAGSASPSPLASALAGPFSTPFSTVAIPPPTASPTPAPRTPAPTAAAQASALPRTATPVPRTAAPPVAPPLATAPPRTVAPTAVPQPPIAPPVVVVTSSPELQPLPTLPGVGRLTFDPPPLDDAIAGSAYRGPLLVNFVTGGSPPYHFQLDTLSGFPPFGVVLAPDGTLRGTPASAAAGFYTFGICAGDLAANAACQTVVMTVRPAPTAAPTATPVVALSITLTGRTCTPEASVWTGYYTYVASGTVSGPEGTILRLTAGRGNFSSDWSGGGNPGHIRGPVDRSSTGWQFEFPHLMPGVVTTMSAIGPGGAGTRAVTFTCP